jgi:formate dehydrogenase subunit delta
MDVNNLIHMANRIGEFYQSYTDKTEALEGIANHIAKFWEPRMRRALIVAMDDTTATGFMPLVMEALVLNKDRLTPSKDISNEAPRTEAPRTLKPFTM